VSGDLTFADLWRRIVRQRKIFGTNHRCHFALQHVLGASTRVRHFMDPLLRMTAEFPHLHPVRVILLRRTASASPGSGLWAHTPDYAELMVSARGKRNSHLSR
jgi:hypothetical protein